jgi:hypothetical protein
MLNALAQLLSRHPIQIYPHYRPSFPEKSISKPRKPAGPTSKDYFAATYFTGFNMAIDNAAISLFWLLKQNLWVKKTLFVERNVLIFGKSKSCRRFFCGISVLGVRDNKTKTDYFRAVSLFMSWLAGCMLMETLVEVLHNHILQVHVNILPTQI